MGAVERKRGVSPTTSVHVQRVPYTLYVKQDWGHLFSCETRFNILFMIRDSNFEIFFHVHVNAFFDLYMTRE